MSNTESMFETAVRTKMRFLSPRGDLTVEQLWDVPLRSRDDFNLNWIAKSTNTMLKTVEEESFVDSTPAPAHGRLTMTLEIVKHVIETKLAEEASAKRRSENKVEKEKLLRILAEKQEGKLSDLTEKELQKRINALD
jgi:hypothetical protein